MVIAHRVLTSQEQRIAEGQEEVLTNEEARLKRPRLSRMLAGLRAEPPRIYVRLGQLYTESFKQTEALPLVMRFAKAVENVAKNIDIAIDDGELIVGRCHPPGRHGVLYPYDRVLWFAKQGMGEIQARKPGKFILTQDDIKIITEEIMPYWEGNTIHERYINALPEETRHLFFDKDLYTPSGIADDKTTMRAVPEWVPDYELVLKKGFSGIKKEAQEKLESLDSLDPKKDFDKLAFLRAVIIVCDAMMIFAKRHAGLARTMAEKENDKQRQKELLEIAEVCDWVPANPARTFREAIQSQWFTWVGHCFEADSSSTGFGRMDQLLYPYYERDIKEGKITNDDVLELLGCHWLHQAEYLPIIYIRLTHTGHMSQESYAHFAQVTLGGLTKEGKDATNELSYLILQSKEEFPLPYPDLMVRVHSLSPQKFLMKACECVKEGAGFPKFLNDEEIVPSLLTKGVTWAEAMDYNGSGCTETRVLSKESIDAPTVGVSLPAVLDMALNDGVVRSTGESLGVKSGDPREFSTFDDVMNAFQLQTENLQRHCFVRNSVIDLVRPYTIAAPLHSCLHNLCMEHCTDVYSHNKMERVIYDQRSFNVMGFGTVVDSLAAIKKLVYEDKAVTMIELLEAIHTNFDGKEDIRQMCLNAPKYGNSDSYADSIGFQIDTMICSYNREYTNVFGGKAQVLNVPVTAHIVFGAMTGATPNGRKAGDPFSEGVGPSQGCDTQGPTAALLSVANARSLKYRDRNSKLLNMKLSPQAVAGDEGTKHLVALLRTWCDLKLWHIQFNIMNSEILRDAQNNPEKYRNVVVRVAGYSAYFVDLSPELQEDIIRRTEHKSV